jgi:alpha-mannosidase
MPLEAHVVTHTHWDREWYLPAERFRQRLVALVDELLGDPPRGDESFLLDGQAIVIEDYLAVRPDRAEVLGTLLRERRIEAGPWYVLADELIPSGEALVRNLLAGRRVVGRFGAASPPVLYCPDSFGHPAVLPSIAKGFGLPLIILWRGYGGRRWPAGDTVRWSAPSGEDVVVFHLPRDGYEFGSHLPVDEAGARARWARMRAELVPRSVTGVMLVPNGADHHARQARFRDALTQLERAGAEDGVHRSSLHAFVERLVAQSAHHALPQISGELRDSYGYTWTLQGTFGTRAHEKRMNAMAERQLVRDTEPWAALAAQAGASQRALVDAAWTTLLAAHPHDTLCGCSIDEVADAMELRIRSAVNQAEGVRDDAIATLIGHDPVAAREARDRWTPALLVRNPAPRARSGVAIVEIDEFLADVPVGPGSAREAVPAVSMRSTTPRVAGLGALQVLSREMRHSRTESPRHYPDNDLVARTKAAIWIPEVPALGVSAYAIGSDSRRAPRDAAPPRHVSADRRSMRNGLLEVDVGESGCVSLLDVASGRRIESLLDFIEESDDGDLYTPAPRSHDGVIQFRGVRRVHRGPLRGELALRYRVVSGHGGARGGDADVTVQLGLDAESAVLRLSLSVENRQTNHRLRLLVRSDVPAAAERRVWADAAFGPVRREPIVIEPQEAAIEHAPPTAPLHRYVSIFGAARGTTLFSDGLAEYEILDDGVAVTLVRAVGELSRNDLPERPGHAGWPTPTPGAQCIGRYAATLGLMLHGDRDARTIDAIERAADDFLVPLSGTTLRSSLGIPTAIVGPELIGEGLAFSAVKESDDGNWLVLRCVNLLGEAVHGRWRLPFVPSEVAEARLDETVMTKLENRDSVIDFTATARAIVTLLVR